MAENRCIEQMGRMYQAEVGETMYCLGSALTPEKTTPKILCPYQSFMSEVFGEGERQVVISKCRLQEIIDDSQDTE